MTNLNWGATAKERSATLPCDAVALGAGMRAGRVTVSYTLRPTGRGTRLHARVLFDGPRLIGWALAFGDVVMMRKQLLTLRELAEREAVAARS